MIIELLIPGEPQGKLRARVSKFGAYTPKKTVNYETYIKELFVIKYPDFIPLAGALIIELMAWLTIPKSTSKKRRGLMLKKIIRPTKRPDVDNILKTSMDALEGLAFKNDNQIATVLASKFYSDQPRLEITIERVL